LVLIDQNRLLEWKALLSYLREHRQELEIQGKMTALVLCLQMHWQTIKTEMPDEF